MFQRIKLSTLNFWVDLVAFVGFVLLISTGFVLRQMLPPGSGGIHGFGSGNRSLERPIDLLWGLTRHEWGDIHFWISLIFLAVLAFHLLLHWRWIVCMMKGGVNEYSGERFMLGVVGFITVLIISAGPFLSKKTTVERSQLIKEMKNSTPAPEARETGELIKGSTTLAEASALAGVSVEAFAKELGLSPGVAPDERLGRLGRAYGFEIDDVRRIVISYRNRQK